VTQPVPEFDEAHEAYEAWRDLQDVLEERDAEWWAEQNTDDDALTAAQFGLHNSLARGSARKAGRNPTRVRATTGHARQLRVPD
jgi:hypothetical protein